MNLHKENNKLSESDFTEVPNLTNIGANTTGKISKLAWLKETVLAQYGSDADLILNSIDEVQSTFILRREARKKGSLMIPRQLFTCLVYQRNMKLQPMKPVQALKIRLTYLLLRARW